MVNSIPFAKRFTMFPTPTPTPTPTSTATSIPTQAMTRTQTRFLSDSESHPIVPEGESECRGG